MCSLRPADLGKFDDRVPNMMEILLKSIVSQRWEKRSLRAIMKLLVVMRKSLVLSLGGCCAISASKSAMES